MTNSDNTPIEISSDSFDDNSFDSPCLLHLDFVDSQPVLHNETNIVETAINISDDDNGQNFFHPMLITNDNLLTSNQPPQQRLQIPQVQTGIRPQQMFQQPVIQPRRLQPQMIQQPQMYRHPQQPQTGIRPQQMHQQMHQQPVIQPQRLQPQMIRPQITRSQMIQQQVTHPRPPRIYTPQTPIHFHYPPSLTQPRQRGRSDKTTTDPQAKTLKCGICWDEESDVVSTLCGHVFCRTCMIELFNNKLDVQCPYCRTQLTKKDVHRLFIDN
ncbi:hypothetical protein QTN25_006096 [Entamoeba marina]